MKRIMIVDDDAAFRQPLGIALQRAGYDVLFADQGVAAMRLFREQAVDLVITDIIMPDQEGLATIMQLHKLQPALPIIAISGGGRLGPTDYLKIACELGAARTLTKPFTNEAILAEVQCLLQETRFPA